jgi:hypothetical protein
MNVNEIWDYSYGATSNSKVFNNVNLNIAQDIQEIIYINNSNYLEYFTNTGSSVNYNIKEFRLEESISIDKNLFIKLNNDVIFNGQGNTIKINNGEFLGLFYLTGGTVMNLNIQKGSSKLVKGSGVGWLLRSSSNGKLINCSCIINAPNNLAYYSAERGSKLTNITYLDRIDYLVIK